MVQARFPLNPVVAAFCAITAVTFGLIAETHAQTAPLSAQTVPSETPERDPFDGVRIEREVDVEALLDQLANPDEERWSRIERQILQAWAHSGSSVIDYLFERGQMALREGRADDAVAHFSVVLDHASDFTEAWNGRATAYFLSNAVGPSLSDIEQVLIRNPRHFGALAGLGTILEQLGRREEALAAYQASLAVHPHQQEILDAVARLELASAGSSL